MEKEGEMEEKRMVGGARLAGVGFPVQTVGVLTFTYTNHRGETAVRNARPSLVEFAATEWHPEPQWVLHAFDADKGAERSFAMKDMRDVRWAGRGG
jgi:hypothetical protein